MRFTLKKGALMYNMCSSTTRKISAATYHRYKPKTVKLQGRIPFRQSCCERCQNFDILSDGSRHMGSIPSEVGGAIDKSLCEYEGYFPDITCVLCTYEKCGTDKYKKYLLDVNASKICDRSRRFLITQWQTKTVHKEGTSQSFLSWKFERCNYVELVDLLMTKMKSMSEHTFMASWNYVQYKQARKNILVGDVIMVHDFAQNYLCKHQKEVQALH